MNIDGSERLPRQPLDLTNQVAIVSGAGSGIGRTIATVLAEAGAAVGCLGRRADALAETVRSIEDAGGQGVVLPVDVTRGGDVTEAVAVVVARYDRLDILVNCAGIYPHTSILDLEEAEWDEVMAVNLRGPFLASREAARVMIAAGRGGRIVNIASVDAVVPERRFTHYDTSKGGLVAFTKSLALELAPFAITVNAVGPALVERPGLDTNAPKRRQAFLEYVPLGRLGTATDVAAAVLFLASPAASFITGQTLYVDGGVMLAGYMTNVDE